MKIHAWVVLGLISLFAAHAPTAEAVDSNHIAISKKVIRETEARYGPEAASRIVAWNDLVEKNKNKSVAEKLVLTNNFFNHIPIKTSEELWGHTH